MNYKSTPDWDKTVRELTGGIGVDHVIEVGGEATLPVSMKAVRMGGTISVIGVLSGVGGVTFVPVLMRSLRLQGIYVGSREIFLDMLRAMSQRETRPVIDRVFPFEELPAALEYMKTGRHFGKICLSFP
ncbi:MAG: zinc-binding dehydrogenase [Bryobacteraceae bacterium]